MNEKDTIHGELPMEEVQSIHYTMYTVQCTLYTIQYTVYNIHFTR